MKIHIHGMNGKDASRARSGIDYAVKLMRHPERIHEVSIEWGDEDEDKVIITVTWSDIGFSEEDRQRLDAGFMERFNCYAEVHLDKDGEELVGVAA
jgi:hypothetical protein